MKYFSSKIFLGLVIAWAGFSASAQEFKVGVVNLDRIFREANSSKAAQTKLEQEFSKREKELNDLATQLKTLSDKFEREAPTLAESQRTLRQRQLVDQDRTFQTKRREFQEDLSTRKNEELQQVIERANKVVKTLAETEKYDLILQE
ncbi:MAG: OmpH family outer membrane protein, partial [Nevskiales bacterium]